MLTNDELIRRLDDHHNEIKTHHVKTDGAVDALAVRMQDIEQKLARGGNGGGTDEARKSWGEQVVEHPDFAALVRTKSGKIRIQLKAITSLGTSAGGLVALDQRLDPIIIPRRALRIRDLLSKSPTVSNAVKYVRQTGRTNNADVVSEGTEKPESNLTYELRTAEVTTIAHWIPAAKQVLDDAPALGGIIDAELRYGVEYEEELQILLGDGTGENLSGLIPNATAYSAPFAPETPQRIDSILLAQAQLAAADLEATGVVLNPIDWARIITTKDNQGKYIAGNPLTAAPKSLWELPVVTSNSVPLTKFLVGDFARAAILFDRQETTVEVSTEASPASVGDAFTKNMVIIRAEKRVALAIGMPEALVYGTFQAGT